MRFRRLSALTLAAVAGAALAALPIAHARAADSAYANGDAAAGAKLAQAHGCASCHGANLSGGFAPKLVGIEQKMSPDQIADKIKSPAPPMPNFGFSQQQLSDLVTYLASLDGSQGKPVSSK